MTKLRGDKPHIFKWEKEKVFEEGYTYASRVGFYNSPKWRKTREYILNQEPLCRMCLEDGKVRPAKIVDHIKPISKQDYDDYINKGDESIVLDFDNLRPLCKWHHSFVTNRERGKRSPDNLRKGRDLMNELEN